MRAAITWRHGPAGSSYGRRGNQCQPGDLGGTVSVTEPSSAEQQPVLYLPQPPDNREMYEYFRKQRRWVFAWLLIASAGVLYGYIHVAERASDLRQSFLDRC
jgi:hypothetical protein